MQHIRKNKHKLKKQTNQTKMKDLKSILLIMLILLSAIPKITYAQIVPNDIPTIEAYINDHKKQRSLLLTRSTLEASNELLHEASKVTNREYRDVNIELDKYTRAFDVIDLVYNTVSTGFNVYRTYDNISDKISKYKTMVQEYESKILSRGKIETADTLLLYVNRKAIKNLSTECKNLYKTVSTIAGYASGEVCCTTASMMVMIESINNSLDRIKDIVNTAYYQTWQFIQARTSYWKRELYRDLPKREIANDAFGRWIKSGRLRTNG